MRMRKKADLPTKVCACCQRPFAWRKKWAQVWDEVKYCSDRCRHSRTPLTSAGSAPQPSPEPTQSARSPHATRPRAMR